MSDLFTFETDHLPAGIRVMSFQGHEALSRPYRYEINLSATHAECQEIDLDAVVNKPARLVIHRKDGSAAQTVHGVVASLESLHEYHDGGLFRAVLVPRLWTLGLNEHSRLFVGDDLPSIIRAVLKAGGLATNDYELHLNGRYRPIEHVCQYQESYLDFISRWMEREGLYYFFKQTDHGEVLVITDHKSVHTESRHHAVPYFPRVGGEDVSTEAFENFVARRQVLPGSVKVKDYNYLLPRTPVEATERVEAHSRNEVVRFGDNALTSSDCRHLAETRSQELLARQTVFHASGPVYGLHVGYLFEVEDHPRATFNGGYLATAITATGQQYAGSAAFRAMLGLEGEGSDTFRVDVEAIHRTVQFRAPAVTPWPRIFGIEPAVIDGDADHDYAQLDDHGRYKVKIKFDEGDLINGKASTRIRMIQPHGGSPEGFHFPLRKNTEVLLVFLGGDPDRPSIIGVGPNGDNPSPVTAGNHTLNVIQTGGENRMEIEDQAGREYVKWKTPHRNTHFHIGAPHNPPTEIHAQSDGSIQFDLGEHQIINIGKNSTTTINGKAIEKVVEDKEATTHGNETTEVKGETKATHIGKWEITLKADEHKLVEGNSEEVFKGTKMETTVGNKTEIVMADVIETTNGNKTATTVGNSTETTNGNKYETTTGMTFETLMGAKTEIGLALSTEILVGGKNEIFVGLAHAISIAAQQEIFIGAKSDINCGPSIELKLSPSIKNGILKVEVEQVEVEEKTTKIGSGSLDLKQAATYMAMAGMIMLL